MQPKAIVMMEDHDKAYHAWKDRGVTGRVLVHVDAHIDFGWVPEMDLDEIGADGKALSMLVNGGLLLNPYLKPRSRMVNIGNYICPAIRDGMVEKFYWVVPDESFRSARGKKHIVKQLERLLKIKRYPGGKIERRKDRMLCRILGKEVVVCGLEALETITAPVLLDIDVDFMLTKHIWDDLNPDRAPWIFPEELYGKLLPGLKDIDVLTIAYSVEGGFTPLKFKYLGDELRCLFNGDVPKAMSGRRKAFYLEREGRFSEACAAYEELLKVDDTDASVYFNLALLHLNGASAAAEKGAFFYEQAVARDRSYATRYNNYGILYLRYNRLKKAESEYKKFLRLNANNTAVLNGLGYIALAGKRYTEAGCFFDRSLAADKNYAEAKLGKAIVNFREKKFPDARALFNCLIECRPDGAEAYWWLGRIAQKQNDVPGAIDNYKGAVMRGGEGPLVHLLLAGLYVKKGLYYRAFEELKRSYDLVRMFF